MRPMPGRQGQVPDCPHLREAARPFGRLRKMSAGTRKALEPVPVGLALGLDPIGSKEGE